MKRTAGAAVLVLMMLAMVLQRALRVRRVGVRAGFEWVGFSGAIVEWSDARRDPSRLPGAHRACPQLVASLGRHVGLV